MKALRPDGAQPESQVEPLPFAFRVPASPISAPASRFGLGGSVARRVLGPYACSGGRGSVLKLKISKTGGEARTGIAFLEVLEGNGVALGSKIHYIVTRVSPRAVTRAIQLRLRTLRALMPSVHGSRHSYSQGFWCTISSSAQVYGGALKGLTLPDVQLCGKDLVE